jgi:hypothetical protein
MDQHFDGHFVFKNDVSCLFTLDRRVQRKQMRRTDVLPVFVGWQLAGGTRRVGRCVADGLPQRLGNRWVFVESQKSVTGSECRRIEISCDHAQLFCIKAPAVHAFRNFIRKGFLLLTNFGKEPFKKFDDVRGNIAIKRLMRNVISKDDCLIKTQATLVMPELNDIVR